MTKLISSVVLGLVLAVLPLHASDLILIGGEGERVPVTFQVLIASADDSVLTLRIVAPSGSTLVVPMLDHDEIESIAPEAFVELLGYSAPCAEINVDADPCARPVSLAGGREIGGASSGFGICRGLELERGRIVDPKLETMEASEAALRAGLDASALSGSERWTVIELPDGEHGPVELVLQLRGGRLGPSLSAGSRLLTLQADAPLLPRGSFTSLPLGLALPVLLVDSEIWSFDKAVRAISRRLGSGARLVLEHHAPVGACPRCPASSPGVDALVALGAAWESGAMPEGGLRPLAAPGGSVLARFLAVVDQDWPELASGRFGDHHSVFPISREATIEDECPAGNLYRNGLRERRRRELAGLAAATGWPLDELEAAAGFDAEPILQLRVRKPWWDRIFE